MAGQEHRGNTDSKHKSVSEGIVRRSLRTLAAIPLGMGAGALLSLKWASGKKGDPRIDPLIKRMDNSTFFKDLFEFSFPEGMAENKLRAALMIISSVVTLAATSVPVGVYRSERNAAEHKQEKKTRKAKKSI